MYLIRYYYRLSKLQIFSLIVILNFILIWITRTYLINEVVFYNAFSDKLTYDRAIQIFENFKNFSWLSYVISPFLILIKCSLISIVIFSGVVLYELRTKLSLGAVFKVVIASELIIVLGGFTKFIWFILFAGNYDFNDLNYYYPLSLITLFDKSELDSIWIYPMQIMNLFQLGYIIMLSMGMNRIFDIQKKDSDKLVLTTYLPVLIIWTAFIVFLSVDNSL